MSVIQSQGYRRDLNLEETPNDNVALDNLMGIGINEDLRFIQNNLRNSSSIPYNNVDSNGFFSFSENKSLQIDSISSAQVGEQTETRIIINLKYPYLLKEGNLVQLKDISESGATVFNGQYSVTSVSADLKTIRLTYPNAVIEKDNISTVGVSFIHNAENIFTFTDDDVVNVSAATTFTVGAATTTLSTGINYYVTQSNGINKFKLSKTTSSSAIGFTTITIAGNAPADTPSGSGEFRFVRKDPVYGDQLNNFILPDIQDAEGDFGYLQDDAGGTVNAAADATQSNIESAEYFSLKKYRGDRTLIETDEAINFEGSVVLNDPANFIEGNGTSSSLAPGVYIGPTRAFSSDNNPWGKVGTALTTSSEEVKIGELSFLDGTNSMVITGIENDVSTVSEVATSFTHKIPIQIKDSSGNSESYFLLVSDS